MRARFQVRDLDLVKEDGEEDAGPHALPEVTAVPPKPLFLVWTERPQPTPCATSAFEEIISNRYLFFATAIDPDR